VHRKEKQFVRENHGVKLFKNAKRFTSQSTEALDVAPFYLSGIFKRGRTGSLSSATKDGANKKPQFIKASPLFFSCEEFGAKLDTKGATSKVSVANFGRV
jgi:hypothetical protein